MTDERWKEVYREESGPVAVIVTRFLPGGKPRFHVHVSRILPRTDPTCQERLGTHFAMNTEPGNDVRVLRLSSTLCLLMGRCEDWVEQQLKDYRQKLLDERMRLEIRRK